MNEPGTALVSRPVYAAGSEREERRSRSGRRVWPMSEEARARGSRRVRGGRRSDEGRRDPGGRASRVLRQCAGHDTGAVRARSADRAPRSTGRAEGVGGRGNRQALRPVDETDHAARAVTKGAPASPGNPPDDGERRVRQSRTATGSGTIESSSSRSAAGPDYPQVRARSRDLPKAARWRAGTIGTVIDEGESAWFGDPSVATTHAGRTAPVVKRTCTFSVSSCRLSGARSHD